jgi:Spy/CpxP family protein refolding chaperone
MKKRNGILIASILALGIIAAAPLVLAGPHGRGHHDGFGMLAHLRHAKEELDLTDQQAAAIHGIFREMRQANTASREQMHGGIHEAAQILLADPGDLAGAQAAIDRQAAAERALRASLLQSVARTFAVLDPGQRAKLRTMIEERHGRFGR